ncbi:MAG: ABC transporter permease [Acetobacteraceae bacterium]|nr:ABC transporter permease [Acetobacteraceae bacterium]
MPKRRGSSLRTHLVNIGRLVIKELRSIRSDPVMLILVVYAFTVSVYVVSTGASTDAVNLSVGVVDEDHSRLSNHLRDALLPPIFQPAREIPASAINSEMDHERLVFVLEIPPRFEQDLLAGRPASVQINVDATAMTQAGIGSGYLQNIIQREVANTLGRREAATSSPVNVVISTRFNPNLTSTWFTSVMQVINTVTLLSVILTGAALIREREQGTIEHLLVMPLVPSEIMLSKILASSLVILLAAGLSLTVVVEGLLDVPIAGSILLFLAGAALYCFAVAALGILLGTIATTMGQFGLLAIPILVVLQLLSGSSTPMESMPVWLQYLMRVISPTPHFVEFAQAVLYRGAGLSIVAPHLAAVAAIAAVYLAISLRQFRRMMVQS